MAIATEVARVHGAMLRKGGGYEWSRYRGEPPKLPSEGLLYEVSVALQGIIEDMPNFKKYIEAERAKIQKQLKKYEK